MERVTADVILNLVVPNYEGIEDFDAVSKAVKEMTLELQYEGFEGAWKNELAVRNGEASLEDVGQAAAARLAEWGTNKEVEALELENAFPEPAYYYCLDGKTWMSGFFFTAVQRDADGVPVREFLRLDYQVDGQPRHKALGLRLSVRHTWTSDPGE